MATSSAPGSASSMIGAWVAGRPSSTASEYRRDAERFVSDTGTGLREAGRADVQGWIDTLREDGGPDGSGLAPSTVQRRLAALSSLFRFLVEEGEREDNPAARCRAPKARGRLSEKILTTEEVRRLAFIGAGAGRDRLVVRTLYALALRASELVRMEQRDLQRQAGGGEEGSPEGLLVDVFGKGGKEATLRLDGPPAGLLWKRAREAGDPGATVFGVSRRTVGRIVKRAARRAQLPEKVSPHWLRHSAVSHMLDAGVPAHEVRDFARHASLETTSTYAHARPDASPGAVLDA